jgi:Cu2+-exporting ATPase
MCTAGCATTLERCVAALPGVAVATANFTAGTLMVDYDATRLSPGQIADAIRAEGFS